MNQQSVVTFLKVSSMVMIALGAANLLSLLEGRKLMMSIWVTVALVGGGVVLYFVGQTMGKVLKRKEEEEKKNPKKKSRTRKSVPKDEHIIKIDKHIDQIEKYLEEDRKAAKELGNQLKKLEREKNDADDEGHTKLVERLGKMIFRYEQLVELMDARIAFFEEHADKLLRLRDYHETRHVVEKEEKKLKELEEKYFGDSVDGMILGGNIRETIEHEGDYIEALDSLADDIHEADSIEVLGSLKAQFKMMTTRSS